MKLKRLRDSQVRFLLLPGKRGAWRAKHLHVPQVDGSRGRRLTRPLWCSRHGRGPPCGVPEGRAMRAGLVAYYFRAADKRGIGSITNEFGTRDGARGGHGVPRSKTTRDLARGEPTRGVSSAAVVSLFHPQDWPQGSLGNLIFTYF